MADSRPSAAWRELANVLLRRDARRSTPHLTRLAVLLVLFFIVVLPASQTTTIGAPGLGVLRSIAFCAAVWAIAVGTMGFVSLLSDEWTGYNLELLQLSGMSGADLLWAKAIPQFGTAISGILLSFPIALFSITLGGVAFVQLGAVYFQLLILLTLVAAFSLFAGAFLRDLSNARTLAAVLLIAYCLGTFLADIFVFRTVVFPAKPSLPQWCLVTECFRILDSAFVGPVANWPSLLHVLVCTGTFAAARRLLSRRWDRIADHPPPEPVSEEQPKQPQPLWRPAHPPPRCIGNPIVWKDYFFTSGGEELRYGKWAAMALPATVVIAAVIGKLAYSSPLQRGEPVAPDVILSITAFFSIFAAVGVIRFTAQRLWQMEIQERTLGSLALLPWQPTEVILAKLQVLAMCSYQELTIFAATLLGLLIYRQWIAAGVLAALLLSLPMIVCTDAAWRFIPRTWEGLTSRGKLVGAPVAAWSLAGIPAVFTHPAVGLAVLAFCVPFVCWVAIDDCASRFAQHAGEISDQ